MSKDNELRGALFQNDKGGVDTRPDYRGRCQIDGKEYRISGWKRKAKASGKPFLSLAFTEETETDEPKQEAAEAAPPAEATADF